MTTIAFLYALKPNSDEISFPNSGAQQLLGAGNNGGEALRLALGIQRVMDALIGFHLKQPRKEKNGPLTRLGHVGF